MSLSEILCRFKCDVFFLCVNLSGPLPCPKDTGFLYVKSSFHMDLSLWTYHVVTKKGRLKLHTNRGGATWWSLNRLPPHPGVNFSKRGSVVQNISSA